MSAQPAPHDSTDASANTVIRPRTWRARPRHARSRDRFAIDERDSHGVHVLALRGELDLASAPSLCARVQSAGHAPRSRVLVDLSGLDFCDVAGLRALIGASREVAANAGRLAVLAPGEGPVARLLTLCGAAEFLSLHRDLDAALGSLARRVATRPRPLMLRRAAG